MPEIVKREIVKLIHGKSWTRQGKVERPVIESLAVSMRTLGQRIPIITFGNEVIDGNCRLLAAPLVPMTHLDSIVLDHEPGELELLEIQYGIDARRSSVLATQRARTLGAMQRILGCTVTELAARTGDSQSIASQLLIIDRGSDAVKALLDGGKLCIERAAMLGGTTDAALIEQAPNLTRDQLRAKIKNKGKPDVKTSAVRLAMPGKMLVTLKGPSFDMPTLVEVLQEAAKQVKKAMGNGHDVTSVQRYLRDGLK